MKTNNNYVKQSRLWALNLITIYLLNKSHNSSTQRNRLTDVGVPDKTSQSQKQFRAFLKF